MAVFGKRRYFPLEKLLAVSLFVFLFTAGRGLLFVGLFALGRRLLCFGFLLIRFFIGFGFLRILLLRRCLFRSGGFFAVLGWFGAAIGVYLSALAGRVGFYPTAVRGGLTFGLG